jgi:cytochrome d ubiquinol oxidase subunit II
MHTSRWETTSHGLEAALNLQNLTLGLTVFFLSRVLGILYFMNNIKNNIIIARAKKQLWFNAVPFVAFFLTFTIALLLSKGFACDPTSKKIYMENFKYFHNFVEMPLVLIVFLAGVVLVLYGIVISLLKTSKNGIWFAGTGTVLTVMSLFLIAGFNHTAYYPSTFDLQSSLTIENSSSSRYTLTAMSYVSLLVPFVIAYIFYAWRAINKEPISSEEINTEHHVY